MIAIALNDFGAELRRVFDAQLRLWAGAAFMALALVAIEYDEVIAPEVSRLTAGLDSVAADFRTKLSSFTL